MSLSRELARALDQAVEQTGGGRIVRDKLGPAVYRLEPTWVSLVACLRCEFLAFIPSLPAEPLFTYTCSQCGAGILLAPPSEALGAVYQA